MEPLRIFPDWTAWQAGYKHLESGIDRYASLKGTLAGGADALLEAFRLSEELGSSRMKTGLTLRWITTRINATTRSTRTASRCKSCLRGWASGVMVQP